MGDFRLGVCKSCVKKDGEWFCTLAQRPYYAVLKCPLYALWKMVNGK